MPIEPAAPPWTDGPNIDQVRPNADVPFAELNQCGFFGVHMGMPLTNIAHHWPVRSTTSKYGRQVPCRSSSGTAYGNLTRRFGAQRPVKPKPTSALRWHCGVDLGGQVGDMVVACQPGRIVQLQTFHLGTWAVQIQNDNDGLVFSYNEVEKGSWHEFNVAKGSVVVAGQPIARVGLMGENSSMLHFEAYRTGTVGTSSWSQSGSAPKSLLNPTKYLLYVARFGA